VFGSNANTNPNYIVRNVSKIDLDPIIANNQRNNTTFNYNDANQSNIDNVNMIQS